VGVPDWKEHFAHKLQLYATRFPLVEVNSTFYRLPRAATAQRWRALADAVNPDFEFTVKVYQGVTHKARFRGEAALSAFSETAKIARTLRARVLLLQCPPSFGPTRENEAALREFLSAIDRDDFLLVWEPRGKWQEAPDRVAEICQEFSLIHCTDPFRALPAVADGALYLRLHGAPPGERMYYYAYTEDDLAWLGERLKGLEADTVYVLFNNIYMFHDALKFMDIWEGRCTTKN